MCPCGQPGGIYHLYDGCNGLPHFKRVYDLIKMNNWTSLDFVDPKSDNFVFRAKELSMAIHSSGIEHWF